MTYFNEIFHSNGQVRPHYSRVYDHWTSLPLKKRRALHVRSKKLFSGDYAQDPLPRILTDAEFEFLSHGVHQRARAIRAFLIDYITKGRRWNSIMPAHVLHSMITRHHAKNMLNKIGPDRLAFPYGPDIIRDREGHWRVIEDSAGILGGMGDLFHSQKILYRLVPRFRDIFKNSLTGVNDPLEFFGRLAQHFKEKAIQNGGIPLLYLHDFKKESDRETRRLAEVFSKFGVEFLTSSNRLRRIELKAGKNGGVFIKSRGSHERVGAMLFRSCPEYFDRRWWATELSRALSSTLGISLLDLMQRIGTERGQPCLEDVLLSRSVWTNFSPGTQFINDKIFGLFVDKMIRRLLGEEPLLKSISAKSVAKWTRGLGWHLDRDLLAALMRNKDRYVVKRVDNDGGTGVWIGIKESKDSLAKLKDELRSQPQRYIIQDFEHLSVLDNRIVDLRIHAHVDSDRIIVSNTPWGRANWIDGNGKVNIGSNGFASPVVVLRSKGK